MTTKASFIKAWAREEVAGPSLKEREIIFSASDWEVENCGLLLWIPVE